MKDELYEKIISYCLDAGADFVEVYYEKTILKKYILMSSNLDNIATSNNKGVGIRIAKGKDIYYASSNNLSEVNLLRIAEDLSKLITPSKEKTNFKLGTKIVHKQHIEISHDDFPVTEKIRILKEIDKTIRTKLEYTTQVQAVFYELYKDFTVANSDGRFVESNEIGTRLHCFATAQKGNRKENLFKQIGQGQGYEFMKDFNAKEFGLIVADLLGKKLDSMQFEGGKVPIILGNGSGAFIFHEACGHALEATKVAENLSVFADKLNKKIASEKVTLIDDGSIDGAFGTTLYDSEGNKTQKNILIKNGVLTSYLIDDLNSKKMNLPSTASGRRESYIYPPTSRMNNTYLAPGNDKIEDMIKSIDYGVYCKSLMGGSVDSKTGDFNFTVDESYLIKNGKIDCMLSEITLIGNSKEILTNVEMVSDDLTFDPAFCGSKSGCVHITIGQPTIKISEILVGGKK